MSECFKIQTLLLIYCAFVGLNNKSLNKCASLSSLIVLPSAPFEMYLLLSVLKIKQVHRRTPVCVQQTSRYEKVRHVILVWRHVPIFSSSVPFMWSYHVMHSRHIFICSKLKMCYRRSFMLKGYVKIRILKLIIYKQ